MRSSLFARIDGLLAPAPPAKRVAFLTAQPFAHRGLHGRAVAENSRAAFTAAVVAGHGIECDVQASRDGEAFVFHDDDLDRLTLEHGPLRARTAAALSAIPLADGFERVPRLAEMLALVRGRVPLLIELKVPDRRVATLCLAVRRALEGYRGPLAIMSFNPEVARWFGRHAPRIVRGLVVTEEATRGWRGRGERHLALWRARPDFLAYDVRDLPSRFAASLRGRGVPVLSWTVRDAETERTALACADQVIYEAWA